MISKTIGYRGTLFSDKPIGECGDREMQISMQSILLNRDAWTKSRISRKRSSDMGEDVKAASWDLRPKDIKLCQRSSKSNFSCLPIVLGPSSESRAVC